MKFLIKSCTCLVLAALFICHCIKFAMADSIPFELNTANTPQPEKTIDEPDTIDETELKLPDGLFYTEDEVYYYKSGIKQTGWQKIKGQKYYFSEKNGVMQTNCIAGTKNTGLYYVDENGIRVTASEIKAAVKYIKKYTKNKQSNDVKLQKCYQALRDNYHYQSSQDTPTVKKLSKYAYNLL